MVVNCVAFGCKNVYSKDRNIQFHTFPFKRPKILKLWVAAIRRQNWEPSRSSRLCCQHFTEKDYKMRPGATAKVLKIDAVPTIFNFSSHLQTHTVSRRVLDYRKGNPKDTAYNTEIVENVELEPIHKDVTQTSSSGGEVYTLQRNIKTLKQKIPRRDVLDYKKGKRKIKRNDVLDYKKESPKYTASNIEKIENIIDVEPSHKSVETQTSNFGSEVYTLQHKIKTLKQNIRRRFEEVISDYNKGNPKDTACNTEQVENTEVKPIHKDKETQTSNSDNEIYTLQRKIKTLKQKIRRKDVKIASMEKLLEEIIVKNDQQPVTTQNIIVL